jgi:hypothetical protein
MLEKNYCRRFNLDHAVFPNDLMMQLPILQRQSETWHQGMDSQKMK